MCSEGLSVLEQRGWRRLSPIAGIDTVSPLGSCSLLCQIPSSCKTKAPHRAPTKTYSFHAQATLRHSTQRHSMAYGTGAGRDRKSLPNPTGGVPKPARKNACSGITCLIKRLLQSCHGHILNPHFSNTGPLNPAACSDGN